jgi:hypothetical protein
MNRIFDRLSFGGRGVSAFLFGAAHVLDLGGTLARYRGRFAQGPRGDLLALQHDWARATHAAWRDHGQAPE